MNSKKPSKKSKLASAITSSLSDADNNNKAVNPEKQKHKR